MSLGLQNPAQRSTEDTGQAFSQRCMGCTAGVSALLELGVALEDQLDFGLLCSP